MKVSDKSYQDFEIRFEYKGEWAEYSADVQITFYVEKDWGADADGNRGVTRTLIQDVKIENIHKEIYDSPGSIKTHWEQVTDKLEIECVKNQICIKADELLFKD